MRLNDPLTTSIEFEGISYPIDLTFDNVLDVFDVMTDKEFLPEEKVNIALELLIEGNDLSLDKQFILFDVILQNYIYLGRQTVEYDRQGNPLPTTTETNKSLDIIQDAKYIYASFRQIGINLLQEQGKLHWEEFQALLESLPDDTILSKIIQIREWKPSKNESSKEKERMRTLQRKYALKKEVD